MNDKPFANLLESIAVKITRKARLLTYLLLFCNDIITAIIRSMSEPQSERRMAENEVVFRQYNEDVSKGLEELRELAKEDNQEHLIMSDDSLLLFYCECSDENCTQRLSLTPSRYNEIHKKRDRFVIVCGHETESIEQVIGKEADFCIIEKFMSPPASAAKLNKTDFDAI